MKKLTEENCTMIRGLVGDQLEEADRLEERYRLWIISEFEELVDDLHKEKLVTDKCWMQLFTAVLKARCTLSHPELCPWPSTAEQESVGIAWAAERTLKGK